MSPASKRAKAVVGYTRVSRQGDRSDEELLSHELQRTKIAAYCLAKDLTLADELFEDTDQSGSKMDRPSFDRAIAGIRAGRYGGIVVARLSRFARNTIGALRLIREIELAGAAFVCIDPAIDTSSASGRAMLKVFLAFYELELEQGRETSADTFDRKILDDGIHVAARAPAGYSYTILGVDKNGKEIRGKLVPNEHAVAVLAAFQLRARGASWSQVAALLTEAGVPTSRGAMRWSLKAAEKLTRNRAYLGEVRHGGVLKTDPETGQTYRTKLRVKEKAHEAIIPLALFNAVQRTRETRARMRGTSEGRLLSGILRCGTCGHVLTLDWTKRPSGERYHFYRCRGESCSRRTVIGAEPVEALVLPVLEERMALRRLADPASRDEAERLRAELDDAQSYAAELVAEIRRGERVPAAALTAAEDRVEAAQEAHDKHGAEALVLKLTTADDRTLPARRAELEAFLSAVGQQVVVSPGRGVDRVNLVAKEAVAA